MPSSSDAATRAHGSNVEDLKAEIRTRLRGARGERTAKRRSEDAIAVASHVLGMPDVRDATCVSIYASRASEPGTQPLIEALADRGVRILLPVLGDGLQRGWGEYRGTEDLVERAPGRPPEPSGDFLPIEELAAADVVLVPALAADALGTRLGQGGGWYDRALVHAREGVPVVALVFADEMLPEDEALPREPHDVPVDAVVTPDGITTVAGSNAT